MTGRFPRSRPRRAAAARRLTIRLGGCPPGLAGEVRRVARAALLGAGAESGTLDVTFVNDGLMRQLHGHWLGANRTTDVLSFDLRAGPGAAGVEGEVVVCLPAARRAARSRGGDWKAEVLLYVAHGCLHLCGYDDRAAKGAARMHRREDDLLESLGWGRVFSGADGRTVPGRRRGEARR